MPATKGINIGFSKFQERRREDRLPIDYTLLISMISLLVIGLVMMTSASITMADKTFGEPFYFAQRQLLFIGFSLLVSYLVWKIPMGFWENSRMPLLISSFLLLTVVLIPGVGEVVNGSRRWIRLGFVNVQISEIVKLFVIIFMAGYLTRHIEILKTSLKAALLPTGILLLFSVLLLAEPDFGATVVMLATASCMMLLAGVRIRYFAIFGSLAAVALFLLAYTSPYRLQRLTTFLDPWADPYNTGFQLSQSLIAFGRGEWFGVGLGESVQKLLYLPEAHTDFVFAIIAEELGVLGAIVVIALYTAVAWRAFRIGKESQGRNQLFPAFVAYGIGSWLIFQAYVNIGVNMGVLPTKGLTLPLISYGGSSMLMSCIAMAMLLRIDYELRFQFREKKKERRAKC